MKRQFITLSLITAMGLVSWAAAQSGSSALFDVKRSQQELEIMRGILNTTLGFVASELRSRQATTGTARKDTFLGSSYWSSNISAFYLYGQGAVFVVPVSGLRGYSGRLTGTAKDFYNAQLDYQLAVSATKALEQEATAIAGVGSGVGRGVAGGVAGGGRVGVSGGVGAGVTKGVPGGVAPEAPAAVQQPAPSATPAAPKPGEAQASQEDARKRLAEAQDRVRRRREESEQERQKLMETIAEARVFLIEALANHGDSLTTVKSNEYINLVLTTDGANVLFAGTEEPASQRQIISVQKSVIIDYKAGRLTLEALKQKVLQYIE